MRTIGVDSVVVNIQECLVYIKGTATAEDLIKVCSESSITAEVSARSFPPIPQDKLNSRVHQLLGIKIKPIVDMSPIPMQANWSIKSHNNINTYLSMAGISRGTDHIDCENSLKLDMSSRSNLLLPSHLTYAEMYPMTGTNTWNDSSVIGHTADSR